LNLLENLDELWTAALELIAEKISKPSFDTWLKNTKPKGFIDDTLTIGVPNDFARDWLEGRYTDLIIDTLFQLTGSTFSIKFVIPEKEQASEESPIKPVQQPVINDIHDSSKTMLNPKYTFDSFVIGAGNRFAHAASLAVAERSEERRVGKECRLRGGRMCDETHVK